MKDKQRLEERAEIFFADKVKPEHRNIATLIPAEADMYYIDGFSNSQGDGATIRVAYEIEGNVKDAILTYTNYNNPDPVAASKVINVDWSGMYKIHNVIAYMHPEVGAVGFSECKKK